MSNEDLFAYLYKKIKESTDIKEVLKEFGGGLIYIPSYKSTKRDEDIREDYKNLLSQKKNRREIMLLLANKYNLSQQRLYAITEDVRNPSLFGSENG